MSVGLLKEYIATILGEDKEQEEKFLIGPADIGDDDEELSDEDELLYRALKKFNLKLVPSGKSPLGYVGGGAYGQVYDAVRNGKRVALKLTFEQDDWNSYVELMDRQDNLPNFVKRSVPHIFESDEIELSDDSPSGRGYATVMEFLVPPPKSLIIAGWHSDPKNIDARSNPNVSHFLTKKATEFSKRFPKIIKSHISDDTEYRNVMRALKDAGAFIKNEQQIKHWRPHMWFSAFFQELISVVNDDDVTLTFNEAESIIDDINAQWKEMLPSDSEFPWESSEDGALDPKPKMPSDKRLRHLMLSMRWMIQNGFLEAWQDVHSDNVMMRPTTGDLVVADVGMFIW